MGESACALKAQDLVKRMVDTLANKEYTKLISSIPPKLSWAMEAERTPENACAGVGKWLDGQLAIWQEEYNKEIAVDRFDRSCMEEIDESALKADGRAIVCYNPTSFGEPLDFWFEIEFFLKNGQVTAVFDINI